MVKVRKWLGAVVQAVGVYVFTLLGIMLSQFAPLLMEQGPIQTPFQWIRLFISAGLALYIVASEEGRGNDAEAKAANIKRRLATAFTHGYTWNGLLGLGAQAVRQ